MNFKNDLHTVYDRRSVQIIFKVHTRLKLKILSQSLKIVNYITTYSYLKSNSNEYRNTSSACLRSSMVYLFGAVSDTFSL